MSSDVLHKDYVSRAKDIYKEYVSHPSILAGYLSQSDPPSKEKSALNSAHESQRLFNVNATWGQKNLITLEEDKFKTCLQFELNHTSIEPLENSVLPTLTQAVLECPSPSGKLQAVILPPNEVEGKDKKQILQIYSQQCCIQSFDFLKYHGNVSIGDFFSGICWSLEEDKIVYTAEKKRNKSRPYFSDYKEDTTPGHEYDFVDYWGEQMMECSSPQIFVLDRSKEEVHVLSNLPEEYSLGQPILADDNSIVCVGVKTESFRLGLRTCYNRTGYLFHLAIDGSFCDKLGEDGRLAFSPRFSPNREFLVYLDQASDGPHLSECRVMIIDWKTKQLNIVIESPDSSATEFRGLFCYKLPRNCFSADCSHMFLSSSNNSFEDVYSLSLQEHKITQMTKEPGTWELFDVFQNLLLASFSTPSNRPRLMVGLFHDGVISQWVQVSKSDSSCRFQDLRWEIRQFIVSESSEHIDAILVHPLDQAKDKKPPLAVYLHGGPYSPCTSQFSLWISSIARLGMLCVVPNFRGTLGYSRASIRTLAGKIGRQDVDDVHKTVGQILSEGLCDPDKVVCIGGSHGGFIAAHLLGQFPKVYRAAVIRNPVTNLASMVGVTDIPDWCYFNCGHEYTQSTIITGEVLDSMLSKSPIIYAKEVQASVLIYLGQRDCRVPNSQGLAYYKLLRSLGKDVKLLTYPKSNHSLRETPVEADGFVNGVSFLLEAIAF
ncbi:Acylamino-acid-releasing enzyme-like [Oopsacas minuta]|uniref:acylaminoacyl-peptidase n=1 Tax=Oopsacas minuta TaxID=111878 RepID=A0AAV7JT96_9METZ|nr:Acylamino-acid-releasing enzyme-like [Oopsacas minuta]